MTITLLDKWKLAGRIRRAVGMSAAAKIVAEALLDCVNNKTGDCHPKIETIAEAVGLRRRRVLASIAELVAGNWLVVKRHRGPANYLFPALEDDGDPQNEVSGTAPLEGDEVHDPAPLEVRDPAPVQVSDPAPPYSLNPEHLNRNQEGEISPHPPDPKELDLGDQPATTKKGRASRAELDAEFRGFIERYPPHGDDVDRQNGYPKTKAAYCHARQSGGATRAELLEAAGQPQHPSYVKWPKNWLREGYWKNKLHHPGDGPVIDNESGQIISDRKGRWPPASQPPLARQQRISAAETGTALARLRK